MNNTLQLYVDDEKTIKGYPVTSPDRVIDENGKSVRDKLKNNVKYDVVGKATAPSLNLGYDDREIKKQINAIDEQINRNKIRGVNADAFGNVANSERLKLAIDYCIKHGEEQFIVILQNI